MDKKYILTVINCKNEEIFMFNISGFDKASIMTEIFIDHGYRVNIAEFNKYKDAEKCF